MSSPDHLIAEDSFSDSVDAPGTGELGTQAMFARALQQLLNNTYALKLHKQDIGDTPFATQAYVDNRGRTARVTAKTHASSPYALLSTDEVLQIDPSGGGFTINLPDPAGGQFITIADTGLSSGTNPITLHRHGAEKILGVTADKALSFSGGTWSVWSDGTNWWVSGNL